MGRKVKAIVLTGNGVNCEMEMAHACRLAGADRVDIVYTGEMLAGKKRLDDYDFLNLPGGFVDGDDLGSAKAGANRFLHGRVRESGERLFDQLLRFIGAGKLVFGVCNGFQLMVKLGLLPGFDGNYARQEATLTFNDSGRFEDRWVYLKVNTASPCVFTSGLERLYLPVRHGEGKFFAREESVLDRLENNGHIVVQYSDEEGRAAVMDYPENPNGSLRAVAGVCDETGRVFGIMPHPEAFLHCTNHPRWTRESLPEEGMGLALFRNAVDFIREKGI